MRREGEGTGPKEAQQINPDSYEVQPRGLPQKGGGKRGAGAGRSARAESRSPRSGRSASRRDRTRQQSGSPRRPARGQSRPDLGDPSRGAAPSGSQDGRAGRLKVKVKVEFGETCGSRSLRRRHAKYYCYHYYHHLKKKDLLTSPQRKSGSGPAGASAKQARGRSPGGERAAGRPTGGREGRRPGPSAAAALTCPPGNHKARWSRRRCSR